MTLDDEFVIGDIKIIEGVGGYFVAMPSRKMSDHCTKCGTKNHLRHRFCNSCGVPLPDDRTRKDAQRRLKLHADIAHAVNARCRQRLQQKFVATFKEELEKSKLPGYMPVELDEPDDEVIDLMADAAFERQESPARSNTRIA